MLPEERYTRIVRILRDHGYAKVEDLAAALQVSEMTIRRDLEKCRESGLLTRTHGGALLATGCRQETDPDDKTAEHAEIKRTIAKICAGMVTDGMSVFLDAGTTTYEIAQAIRGHPCLTVVTNDLRIAHSLLGSEPDLVLMGGWVQKRTGSMMGLIAENIAKNMQFDIAFFGASAISDRLDVMTPNAEKTRFKIQVLENSNTSYLVADHSKFRRRALHRVNNLSDYTGTITDYVFTKGERNIIADKGIAVIPVL